MIILKNNTGDFISEFCTRLELNKRKKEMKRVTDTMDSIKKKIFDINLSWKHENDNYQRYAWILIFNNCYAVEWFYRLCFLDLWLS